jgi:hypothetical protein
MLAVCPLECVVFRLFPPFRVVKKFGGKGKKRTFAIPNEKRVAAKAGSSL